MLGILNMILPSEHVFNGYFSNPNFVRRPRTKLKMWNFGYLCCFLTDFTQINTESKQNFIQSINSNNCFRLKSWIFILALAPSFPLLNYPFNCSLSIEKQNLRSCFLTYFNTIHRLLLCYFADVLHITSHKIWIFIDFS